MVKYVLKSLKIKKLNMLKYLAFSPGICARVYCHMRSYVLFGQNMKPVLNIQGYKAVCGAHISRGPAEVGVENEVHKKGKIQLPLVSSWECSLWKVCPDRFPRVQFIRFSLSNRAIQNTLGIQCLKCFQIRCTLKWAPLRNM